MKRSTDQEEKGVVEPKGIKVLRDTFDYYSINVEVNLDFRRFAIFTKRSLPLHTPLHENSSTL